MRRISDTQHKLRYLGGRAGGSMSLMPAKKVPGHPELEGETLPGGGGGGRAALPGLEDRIKIIAAGYQSSDPSTNLKRFHKCL